MEAKPNLFAAASAPRMMIGRSSEMESIRQAIYGPGEDLRVIYLVGEGGLGKSRLLAEIKRAVDAKPGETARLDLGWRRVGQHIVVSQVLDLEPVHLATTLRFVNDLANVLDPKHERFLRFRLEHSRHRQALVFQSSYEQLQSILYAALRAFEQDYAELAQQQRIVLLLDTGEKFSVPIPDDFDKIAEQILASSVSAASHAGDTPIYTRDWLRRLLTERNETKRLKNTTIVMAGRPHGNWWDIFGDLSTPHVRRIELPPLTVEEIPAYFEQLTKDMADPKRFEPSRQLDYAVERLHRFTEPSAAWTLWAYTEGQPVRLALVADLIIDGAEEPPQLENSREQVQQELGWDEQSEIFTAKAAYQQAKSELSAQFVKTLFDSPITLRTQILSRLVRAHHPLDAVTLEYLIDGMPGEHYWTWIEGHRSSEGRLRQIEQELNWLQHLAFFKSRRVRFDAHSGDHLQVFLQDVMYEIFDDYFGAASEASRLHEIEERKEIYGRLIEVINHRIAICETGLKQIWLEERRTLDAELHAQSIYAPHGLQALSARFPNSSEVPFIQHNLLTREELRDHFEELHLERLYYTLRIDPKAAINDDYGELADAAWLEHDEDFMTQVEVQAWRLLTDTTAHKLVEMVPAVPAAILQSDLNRFDPWRRLQRVVHQDHALRWLKRLHLRGRYDEVAKMAAAIRTYALQVPKPVPLPNEAALPSSSYHSWNHTLTEQETHVYEGYALAYTGQMVRAVEMLTTAVAELRAVFDPGHPERGEKPFKLEGSVGHKAVNRVRRVIAVAQFVLGYAHAAQGDFDLSHNAYNAALTELRKIDFPSLEVYCRFNRARVLAELGSTAEAAKNCEDALSLLTNAGKGGTLPFAYASNTLALVHNAQRSLTPAWMHATVANACFHRMAEERGIALAELQLGEALRRMADVEDRQEYSPYRETPRRLYQESAKVLYSAYERILTNTTLSREGQRHAEAAIELASSLRDQVRVLDIEHDHERACSLLRYARRLFLEADTIAEAIGHNLLRLDAQWGLATLLYRASRTKIGRFAEDETGAIPREELVEAFETVARFARDSKLIEDATWLSLENVKPARGGSQSRAVRRLGRVFGRLGRIYAEEFHRRSKDVRCARFWLPYVNLGDEERHEIQNLVLIDADASHYLEQMADNYVKALGYALMYNPNAALYSYLTSDLYDHIKGFNDATMLRFTEHLSNSEDEFHLHALQNTQGDSIQLIVWRLFGSVESINTRSQQGA